MAPKFECFSFCSVIQPSRLPLLKKPDFPYEWEIIQQLVFEMFPLIHDRGITEVCLSGDRSPHYHTGKGLVSIWSKKTKYFYEEKFQLKKKRFGLKNDSHAIYKGKNSKLRVIIWKKANMWLTLGSSCHIILGWKFSKPFTAAGVVFFQSHFLLIQHIGTSPPDKSFHFAGGRASKSHIIAKRQ